MRRVVPVHGERSASGGSERTGSECDSGRITGFLPGIELDIRVDDGSDAFDREYRELFPNSARTA